MVKTHVFYTCRVHQGSKLQKLSNDRTRKGVVQWTSEFTDVVRCLKTFLFFGRSENDVLTMALPLCSSPHLVLVARHQQASVVPELLQAS